MRHGYYLAATRTRHGDPPAARLARLLWRSLGHRAPCRVDGVSVWLDGVWRVKVVARSFFANDRKQYGKADPFDVPHVHVLEA